MFDLVFFTAGQSPLGSCACLSLAKPLGSGELGSNGSCGLGKEMTVPFIPSKSINSSLVGR